MVKLTKQNQHSEKLKPHVHLPQVPLVNEKKHAKFTFTNRENEAKHHKVLKEKLQLGPTHLSS